MWAQGGGESKDAAADEGGDERQLILVLWQAGNNGTAPPLKALDHGLYRVDHRRPLSLEGHMQGVAAEHLRRLTCRLEQEPPDGCRLQVG